MAEKDKICQLRTLFGECGRELYDKEYCIFHSKNPLKDVKLFQKRLNETFEDKTVEVYDFWKFIFPANISFPDKINKRIIFSEAIFYGDTRFNTTFYKDADFKGAIFRTYTSFSLSTFKESADFWSATFEKDAYFVSAIFQKDVSFESSIFKGLTQFFGATFKGNVKFNYATFEDTLILNEEENNKIFTKKEVDFRYVKFLRPEMVRFKKVDLGKFRFLGTDLRKIEFVDVDWDMKTGRSRVYDAIEPDPVTKKFDYPLIAQLYKRLRVNYEENLNYSQAGDFHIGEMEMYRKGKRDPIDRGIILIYKLLSNYGESYRRPLFWIALLLLLFPFLYMLVGIAPKVEGSQIQYYLDFSLKGLHPTFEMIKDYWSSFIYSFSVSSLIRERPYHTINNLGHFFTIVESILSPVLIAFFLLALRRKFKR